MVPLLFANQEFRADGQGALWWPDRRALLIADLHLEKGSWFGALGQMLPPYDSLASLERLEALLDHTGARALWCLGDSFHDARAVERLGATTRERLDRMARRVDWLWIAGNHDMAVAPPVGQVADELHVAGIDLRHEARPECDGPEISGHFHPKWTVRHQGQRVSRRCFIYGDNKLILPAFGAFTGGLNAADPAVRRALGKGAARAEALIPAGRRLLRFAVA